MCVLDVGSAYGYVAESRFSHLSCVDKILCVDINEKVIDRAKVIFAENSKMIFEVLDVESLDNDDVRPIWFENRGLFITPSLIHYGITEREQKLIRVLWYGSNGVRSYMLDQYDRWWRCWNDKPSIGQAENTPWND